MNLISNPLDIKLGQFRQELDVVLRRIKNRKARGFDEIPPEVWKTRKFDDILQRCIQPEYDGQRAASSLFPKKSDLGIV